VTNQQGGSSLNSLPLFLPLPFLLRIRCFWCACVQQTNVKKKKKKSSHNNNSKKKKETHSSTVCAELSVEELKQRATKERKGKKERRTFLGTLIFSSRAHFRFFFCPAASLLFTDRATVPGLFAVAESEKNPIPRAIHNATTLFFWFSFVLL
jgi:hypothetical protein